MLQTKLKILRMYESQFFYPALILFISLTSLMLSMGMGPLILGDELIYSFNSRFVPGEDSNYANYFYFDLMSATAVCGPQSYFCGKVINWSLALVSAVLVFSFASRFLAKSLSFALSLFFVSGPFVIYMSLFMPEVAFVTAIVISLLLTVRLNVDSSFSSWAMSSIPLALATLIKPHALLIFPAIALYFIVSKKDIFRSISWSTLLSKLTVFFTAALAVKFIYGFFAAGPRGLNIFGPSYEGSLSAGFTSSGPTQAAPTLWEAISPQLILMPLAALVLLGPVLYVLFSSWVATNDDESNLEPIALARIMSLAVPSLVLLIGVFAALITIQGDDHSARTLFRYIDPYISIAFLAAFIYGVQSGRKYIFAWILIPIQLAIYLAKPFPIVSVADSSFLRAVIGESQLVTFGWIIISVLFLTLLTVSASKTNITTMSSVLIVLVVVGSGVWQLDRILQKNYSDSTAFTAASVVSEFAPPGGRGVVFLGNQRTEVDAAILLADLHLSKRVLASGGTPIPSQDLPDDTSWVVSLQEVYYAGDEIFTLSGPGYKISLIGDLPIHYFGQNMKNGLVVSESGLSEFATNGQWVTDNIASLQLRRGLDEVGDYEFTIQYWCSFDCSSEAFELSVGEQSVVLGGANVGEVVEAKFIFESTETLQNLVLELPDSLVNKVGLRMVSFSPR